MMKCAFYIATYQSGDEVQVDTHTYIGTYTQIDGPDSTGRHTGIDTKHSIGLGFSQIIIQ